MLWVDGFWNAVDDGDNYEISGFAKEERGLVSEHVHSRSQLYCCKPVICFI